MKFNLLGKVASLVLGTAMLTCPANLQAGWGILHGGSSGGSSGFGSGGSSGGYAASYSSYGGSSGGSSGYAVSYASSGGGSSGLARGPGLLQRLHNRIHARRAYRASYGSSGYGSSGYSTSYASSGGGSSGGSSGGYGVSYGSSGGVSYNYGSVGYSSGVSYGSTGYSSSVNYGSTGYSSGYGGVYYSASNVDVGAETEGLVSSVESNSQDDAVYLTVAVPNGAKVYVNDNETTSSGVVRKFVSRGLQAGKQYRFEVRAEMVNADGKLMTEEKTLVVSAGEEQQVQFAFAEQDSRVETAITLNLPEGAKVTLAGNVTKATGEARTFRTSRLKSGEFWDDYEIEVEYQGEVKRQAIRLVGGDKLQLSFDFDSPTSTLAAR
ncbi:MAG: TIGR03000 domain-containing protein [Pirellulaceae bacterium]|jgi:uncharacterized protein (TIGR03000 family)|nr:TIGR03000 domain-containing protein [Pirellulaceae bacterium]